MRSAQMNLRDPLTPPLLCRQYHQDLSNDNFLKNVMIYFEAVVFPEDTARRLLFQTVLIQQRHLPHPVQNINLI